MMKTVTNSEKPVEKGVVISDESKKIQLNLEDRLQLEEQIRKFVQLVTQTYLLSFGASELNFINESSKQILKELSDLASENNLFNAHNLNGALDIVKEFEEKANVLSNSKPRKAISYRVKKTIFNSEVFMYPELLPTCSFIGQRKRQKISFIKAEDYLIALGLERFSNDLSPIHKIQTHILPGKTVQQIRFRIKNLRASTGYKDNPIKYYFTHKKTPPLPRYVQIFDPNKVRAPKDLTPTKDLPAWMMPLFPKGKYVPDIIQLIIPKPQAIIYKPLFILPKSVTMQNGNILHSFIQKEKKIAKTIYKPAFILPKGTERTKKELNSNVANQPNLESDMNSTTKCTSEQDKPLDIADKKKDETVNKDVITTQFTIDKLNIKRNECSNADVINKNNEVLNNGMTEPLVRLDYKCVDNITTKNVKYFEIQNKGIVKPSVTTGDDKSSEKKKDIKKNSETGKVIARSLFLTDVKSSNIEIKSSKKKNVKKNSATDKVAAKSIVVTDSESSNIEIKSNEKKRISATDKVVTRSSVVTDSESSNIEIESNEKKRISATDKVVAKPLIFTDTKCSEKKKNIKLPLLPKVVIKPLFVVDDKNPENKQFSSRFSISLNNNECHKVLGTEQSNVESNTISTERNYSKNEKISKTVDFYPDPNGKECGVIIKSEIIDESYEAFNVQFPTPEISYSSPYSVNKSNIIQTPRRNFEECKNEPQSSICVNQKIRDFKNENALHVENEKITFIEDSIRKDVNNTEGNKCESDSAPNILKKVFNFPVGQEVSNSQQLSNYVYEANSNERDNEPYVESSSDELSSPDVDVSTCSNKNKIQIADIFCETSEKINNKLTTSGKVIKSVELIGDCNVKDCDIVIKSEVMKENSNSLQDICLKDCETAKMTPSFVENKTNNVIGLTYMSKHAQPQNVNHIKQEEDFDIVQTPESAHINIDKRDICTELATSYNNKQDLDNIKCNKQLTKTIDFFPDLSEKTCGIVIKSEIIEESYNSLEDTCKVDFNLEKCLYVNSSSAIKSYNTRLKKRNLKSVDQSSITKKRKILQDSIETAIKFTKSTQYEQLHNSYLTQNIESDDGIPKTIFDGDVTAYSEKVPIKSEIMYDCETHLKNDNDVIFSKPVLRTRKNVIKSNSLEIAHLKRSKRTTSQKRRKQNYQSKKKVRKKH